MIKQDAILERFKPVRPLSPEEIDFRGFIVDSVIASYRINLINEHDESLPDFNNVVGIGSSLQVLLENVKLFMADCHYTELKTFVGN